MHFDNESNVIDVYVRHLRKKIDEPFPTRLLHTLTGYGYVLRRGDKTGGAISGGEKTGES